MFIAPHPNLLGVGGTLGAHLPGSIGGIVIAGGINGWFTIFFLVVYLLELQ